jgi:hypothetical protein
MKSKTIVRFFIVNVILALLMAGCITIVTKTEPAPTQPKSVEPTLTQAALTQTVIVQPTKTQAATVQPTLTQAATVQPSLKEYSHISNSFSLSYPADWKLTEYATSASIISPDQSEYISIFVLNTGNELDATLFTNFVNAYEVNNFSAIINYKETKRDIQPDKNYALVTKTLDINKIPSVATTQYEKKGKVIYIENYIIAVSAISKWSSVFTQVVNSFKSNPAYAENWTPYTTSLLTYHGVNNLFTINIPTTWKFQKDLNGVIGQDISISPDGNGYVMIQEHDLGKEVTRPVADAEALRLVKDMDENARIAHIDTFKDGTKEDTIQWTWAPQNGRFQAVSLHKGNGTVFYMITFVIGKGYTNIYGPTMNDLMKTYTVPQ